MDCLARNAPVSLAGRTLVLVISLILLLASSPGRSLAEQRPFKAEPAPQGETGGGDSSVWDLQGQPEGGAGITVARPDHKIVLDTDGDGYKDYAEHYFRSDPKKFDQTIRDLQGNEITREQANADPGALDACDQGFGCDRVVTTGTGAAGPAGSAATREAGRSKAAGAKAAAGKPSGGFIASHPVLAGAVGVGVVGIAAATVAGVGGGEDGDDGGDGGGGGNGKYVLYRGTQQFTVTATAPNMPTLSNSGSGPMELVVDPDGRVELPPSGGMFTTSQNGNSFTVTVTVNQAGVRFAISWRGVVSADRITGTIDGSGGGGPGVRITARGSFTLDRAGEYDHPPATAPPTIPSL